MRLRRIIFIILLFAGAKASGQSLVFPQFNMDITKDSIGFRIPGMSGTKYIWDSQQLQLVYRNYIPVSTGTTNGDLMYYNGTSWVRIGIGSTGNVLTISGGIPAWGTGGSGVTTVSTFSGSAQTNGATISGSTITFGPASATVPGMVSTGSQTWAGTKTFSSDAVINSLTIGHGGGNVGTNTALGNGVFQLSVTGVRNTAVGGQVMTIVSSGSDNTGVGYNSLGANLTTGSRNTAVGSGSAGVGASVSDNTAIGYNALLLGGTGGQNTVIGSGAGANGGGTFSGDVFIGYQAGYNETGSNKLYIANSSTSTPLIYGDFSAKTLQIYGSLQSNTPTGTAGTDSVVVKHSGKYYAIAANYYGTGSGLSGSGYVKQSGTTSSYVSAIPNTDLANSSVTVNGSSVALGSSVTITANTPNSLTAGYALTGTAFNGSTARTWTVDTTKVSTPYALQDTIYNHKAVIGYGLSYNSGLNSISADTTSSTGLVSKTRLATNLGGYLPLSGGTLTGTLTGTAFNIGSLGYSDTNVLGEFTSNVSGYNQFIIRNLNSGSTSSANIIVNNDQSSASNHYVEMGMNSSGFTGSGAFNGAGNAYLDVIGNDLAIGTLSSNAIHFVVNGGTTDAATISATGVFSLPGLSTNGLLKTSGGTGAVSVATAGTDYVIPSGIVDLETPSGTINGSNTSFTLANTPITGSVHLYKNGQLLSPTTDYTISGSTITMVIAPTSTPHLDKLLADYRK